MNPVQYERLQKLIAESALLSPAEKTEWASLLVVMNDKQIAELEQILLSPADASTSPAPATASVVAKPHVEPVLPPDTAPVTPTRVSTSTPSQPIPASASHARVPFSGVIMNPPRVGGSVDPVVPVAAPAAKPSEQVPFPAVPLSAKPQSKPSEPVLPRTAPVVAPVAAKNMPAAMAEVAVPLAPAAEAPHLEDFRDISDVAKLSLAYFRSHIAGELQQQLKQLVMDHGYFAVRAELEQSPLFHTYVQSGLLLLSGQHLSQQFLSREEWETMADILASIRRN